MLRNDDQCVDVGARSEDTKTEATIGEDLATRRVDNTIGKTLRFANLLDEFFGDGLQ